MGPRGIAWVVTGMAAWAVPISHGVPMANLTSSGNGPISIGGHEPIRTTASPATLTAAEDATQAAGPSAVGLRPDGSDWTVIGYDTPDGWVNYAASGSGDARPSEGCSIRFELPVAFGRPLGDALVPE